MQEHSTQMAMIDTQSALHSESHPSTTHPHSSRIKIKPVPSVSHDDLPTHGEGLFVEPIIKKSGSSANLQKKKRRRKKRGEMK